MNREKFDEHNEEMAKLKRQLPQKEFDKVLGKCDSDIREKAKMPTVASFISGWGFLALFLLTGFLSGWTVGVLWVVATISGAGLLGSAIGGIAGHLKYRRYLRAMRTRNRLKRLRDDGKNHFDQERLRLEKSLNRDLAFCRKKRMISDTELQEYANVLPRPVVLANDVVKNKQEEIAAEADKMNRAMTSLQTDVDMLFSERNADMSQTLDENIDPSRHFEGSIKIGAQKRDAAGELVEKDTDTHEPDIIESSFAARSDKEFAVALECISQRLRERYIDGVLPFPVTIECFDKDGTPISIVADGDGRIVLENGALLTSENNPLEAVANAIYGSLPTHEPRKLVDYGEQDIEQEQENEDEQAQTR